MQGKRTNVTRVFFEKILKYGLSSLIFTITLAIGLVIINYIAAIKAPYIDVTKHKLNTLTYKTKSMLEDIHFNVDIKAFYTAGSERRLKQLFEKYAKINDGITYEFIDPLKNPVLAEQFNVSLPRTIVFDTAGKQTRINPPFRGNPHSERDITIALYRLMTEETKTVYFSTGHGEFRLENAKQDGLSIIKQELIEQNYLVNTVNLLEEGQIPEDCSILIVAGLTVPFTDEESQIVKKYLDDGGSIFLMVPPAVETNLDIVMNDYGIIFGDDYIYETSSKLSTDMYGPISPLCSAQDSSDITESLPNQNFLFPFVRSVNKRFSLQNIKVTGLLASSENSWAETDIESAKTVNTNQKPTRSESEKKGPITVAAITDREHLLPDSLQTRNIASYFARSVFFGNARLITNSFTSSFPSNLNLFLNTVNWTTRNEKIIEITPHIQAFTPVELRQSQRRLLTWLTLVIFPSSILLVGIIIWYRRR